MLLNIYESVDVLTLIKGGSYEELNLSVGEALLKRPDVSFSPLFLLVPCLTITRTSPEFIHAPPKTV